MKVIIFLFFIQIGFSKTGLPGFNSWSSVTRISMAGAGYLALSPNSLLRNPGIELPNNLFTASFVKYPSDIHSNSVSLSFKKNNFQNIFFIKHIDYGLFEGYDEKSILTNNYTSNDTWINFCLNKKSKNSYLSYGLSGGIFLSKLEDYFLSAFYASIGLVHGKEESGLLLGLTIENLGLILTKDYKKTNQLPSNAILSIKNKLRYLPLSLYIDFISSLLSSSQDLFIGGEYLINNSLKFNMGTSTRKFSQSIDQALSKKIFGSSGFGLQFNKGVINITLGSYFYGNSSMIFGSEIYVLF